MSKDTQDNVGMSYLDSNATKLFKTYFPLVAFLFVLLFPFYWMGITAFKPDNELLVARWQSFLDHQPHVGAR